MKNFKLDWKKYADTCRQTCAEGAVLLKNDGGVLPVKKGSTVALFGRTQFDYIKSGTGSGGLVNVPYVVNYYEGFEKCGDLKVYEPLVDIYKGWLEEHPFDKGGGWAQEPTSQVEMPLSEETVKDAAAHADTAIIFIARLCGEDKDFTATPGAYYLSDSERAMMSMVTKYFTKTAVLINSGDIIDMNWVVDYDPSAILYVWQGGCEGGNAAADLVAGITTPSGKLTETIAEKITDYPSDKNFGDPVRNFYQEDIYVGYRYFETFARDCVIYPFGYGLSYTSFDISYSFSVEDHFRIRAQVTNTGLYPGKEVVQVYVNAPQGFLGKPLRSLAAFGKTKTLAPGESDELVLDFGLSEIASYDDTGMTGHKNAFVCESGEYIFYAGTDVRSAEPVGSFVLAETTVVEETQAALYPISKFDRIIPEQENGTWKPAYVETPLRDYDLEEKILKDRESMQEIPYTGDQGIRLSDVKEGKRSMEEFVGQLTDEEMIVMSRGEGMSSPRVVPGTCAAYGGVSDSLQHYGIPAAACTDGPSGLRIDSGVIAMQGPNGSCLSSTWNTELVGKLYSYIGEELLRDKIDCLLGPGMNIKRHPLNGRNFEYFSEDPLVTGLMAKAQLDGMRTWNTTGCIKHFACNNQETARYQSDAVVSARALREIYLKGFEIAVRQGKATHIMTTYGSLNGWHTAGSYELTTTVLRKDWGFEGVAVTDWWAVVGKELDEEPVIRKTSLMIRAQNDLYMVANSSLENANDDDSADGLKNGTFSRTELQRNTKNILNLVMNTPAYDRMNGREYVIEDVNRPAEKETAADAEFVLDVTEGTTLDADRLVTTKGAINMIRLRFAEKGDYRMLFELSSEGGALSQLSATFAVNNTVMKVITRNGGKTEWTNEEVLIGHGASTERFLKITFSQTGLKFRNIRFEKEK